jgi:hypothetical protein
MSQAGFSNLSNRAQRIHLAVAVERVVTRPACFLSSLLFEYRCAARWSANQGYITTMKVNKLTGTITVINRKAVSGT